MIGGDIPTFTGGTWFVAELDTPEPANIADAQVGFTDEWPDGWMWLSKNPNRKVALEKIEGRYYLITTRPLRHVQYARGVMLGWECECRYERLVASHVVKVNPNRYRLRQEAVERNDRSFLIWTISSSKSCAWPEGAGE